MLNPEQKQRLREAVVEYLAGRPTMSFKISSIHRMIYKNQLVDFAYSEDDIAETLALLEGFEYVKQHHPPLGSIPEFQITAQGVLFHERNQ